ncbi:MAG: L-asparaginase 1, partial [Bacteroidia bacterium]|nr:L-asparaginase 1 [Bacteroidia bacterium]
ITYNTDDILKPPKKKLVVHKKFCNEIAIIHFFPGITSDYVSNILQNQRLKAVILKTFGAGNAPKIDWLAKEVKNAVKEGKIVFNVSQCERGEITQGKYETSKWLKDAGVIAGKDITTEAAITKLMYLMAGGYSNTKVKKLLMSNLRGEMSP